MSSSYLQFLPAILQQGEFLGKFLLAFEAVLSGVDLIRVDPKEFPPEEKDLLGLEQLLDSVHTFFDPKLAPAEDGEDFLSWLAQWVATSLRDDWSLEMKRRFLGGIVPLYRMRGTRRGIEEVLRLSGEDVQVVDFTDGLHEDEEKKNFGPGLKPPHFFGVILTLDAPDPVMLARMVRRVRAIVDREKPAHTFYGLRVNYPAMRINNDPVANPGRGPGILVNRNTVIGTTQA